MTSLPLTTFMGGAHARGDLLDLLEKAWRRVTDDAIDEWARGVAAAFVVAATSKVGSPLWANRAILAAERTAVVAQAPAEFVAQFARGYGEYVRGRWAAAFERFAQLVDSAELVPGWRRRLPCPRFERTAARGARRTRASRSLAATPRKS